VIWLFAFCEGSGCVSGKWQCAKCVSEQNHFKLCGGIFLIFCPPFFIFLVGLSVEWSSFRLAYNVLALGAVADFGAQNCQYTTKVDAR